jgi:3alpha(or 20beta)-hydroxysteroid dehydrogenase
MTDRLAGKSAIITGAARGSGAAIAHRFVGEGAAVVLADVLDERGEQTAADLGDAARYVHCDVTQETDWAALIDAAGEVDILVNNAGILHLAAIADTSVETVRRIFEVNELGPFIGIKAVIEPMRRRGGGSIVNISSIDGLFVTPGTAAYAASKFALRGLTKTAALELGRFGIRVNAVCPAAGNSEMVAGALPPDFDYSRVAAASGAERHRAPIGRRGQMVDVADAALFFASDESTFVTGTDLLVDGGLSAGMIIPGQPGT